MKGILRHLLINLVALLLATKILPGLVLEGGFQTLLLASIVFMGINFFVVPVLRLMFLPLNLLTLGLFSWAVNVLALYFLTAIVSEFKIVPFHFEGVSLNGILIPPLDLNTLHVAILASFVIGLTTHFIYWLVKK